MKTRKVTIFAAQWTELGAKKPPVKRGGFFADGLSGFGVRRFVFLFGAVSGAGFVERHFIIG